jgi:hypothetical protein
MKEGGIFPAIVGTIVLVVGTMLFSLPLSVLSAIYLVEYARDNFFTRSIKLSVVNLSGIPSIVYGLFGFTLFVLFLKLGTSILAGSLTLAIMSLPVIITATKEALESVPVSFREISLSLGATRWQTVLRIALCDTRHSHRDCFKSKQGSRRNSPNPLYGCCVLSAPPAAFGFRPGYGAAIPSLCYFHAGAEYTGGAEFRYLLCPYSVGVPDEFSKYNPSRTL